MHLPDFKEFEPFNRMRAQMQTDKLGHFELFDPNKHLTGEERSALERQGLMIASNQVGRLLDFTLSYKNSRIVLVQNQQLHLANCPLLPKDEVCITTSLKPFKQPPNLCNACLQQLNFEGYDEQKARKAGYNAKVLQQFSLANFWRLYPPYPLNRDRELIKPLSF